MLSPGTHELGPENGTLSVRTGRKGAAAKAGHDLLIRVTAWKATIEVGDGIAISLDADPTSLRVLEGTGGMQALDDGDRDNIRQTIDDEVLLRQGIAFRSTSAVAAADGSSLIELELKPRPAVVTVKTDGGADITVTRPHHLIRLLLARTSASAMPPQVTPDLRQA